MKLVVRMISKFFLYKNLRFIRIFYPDLRQYWKILRFSHLVIRIFLHFHAVVLFSALLIGL